MSTKEVHREKDSVKDKTESSVDKSWKSLGKRFLKSDKIELSKSLYNWFGENYERFRKPGMVSILIYSLATLGLGIITESILGFILLGYMYKVKDGFRPALSAIAVSYILSFLSMIAIALPFILAIGSFVVIIWAFIQSLIEYVSNR